MYNHTLLDLELLHGRTYYITVTLVDTIGRRTNLSSNGVRVDATPPLPGAVYDGRLRDFADTDFTWSSKVFSWWDLFSDPESGIKRFQVACTTDPDGRTVDVWTDVQPGTVVSVFTKIVPDGTVLYHHVRAWSVAGLYCIVTSDGVMVDSRPPPRGDVGDGVDAALSLYQKAPYNGTSWDQAFQRSLESMSGRWRGFVGLPPPNTTQPIPPRLRGRPSRIEVGISRTRAPPPGGVPDVVSWVACDPGDDAPVPSVACADIAAPTLEALLLSCWNETLLLERLPWEKASWPVNCTCLDALVTYRSSCIYQGLDKTDDTRLLVDRLHDVCAPPAPPAPCAPWQSQGNFTAVNLTLREPRTYYVLVRATAPSGIAVVVASDGVTVDRTPPSLGWLETSAYTNEDGFFDVFVFWGGWADPDGFLNHYELCIGPEDAVCTAYVHVGLTSTHHFRLPPAWGILYHQVCIQVSLLRASCALLCISPALSPAVLRYTVLCCAVLYCAVLCCGVVCCAVLCYAVLCCVVLCYAVLCYAVLHCAVLCYAVLCYAVLHCAVLCCAVVWCGVLCCVMLCCAVLCYTVLCCAVLCCAVPHSTAQHSTAQHNTAQLLLCCVVLCCAVLCCAVLCCVMLCCVMLCCAVLCCAVLCYAVLCCAVLCCALLCYAVLCCAVLCCAVLCYAVLCCAVVWCGV